MTDARRFRVNMGDVAAKVIDGEAIVMNISNGAYYSITGAGAAAWELLESGRTVTEAAGLLAERYEAPLEIVMADLETLLVTLIEEGLMTEAADRVPESGPGLPAGPRVAYEATVFQKFTDMADMLALDPPMPGFDETPWATDNSGSRTG